MNYVHATNNHQGVFYIINMGHHTVLYIIFLYKWNWELLQNNFFQGIYKVLLFLNTTFDRVIPVITSGVLILDDCSYVYAQYVKHMSVFLHLCKYASEYRLIKL